MSPAGRRALIAGVFCATLGVGSGFVWWDARPTVRIVNATHHPLRVRIDEGRRASVVAIPPTSTETSDGGVVLRLAPGHHVFAVLADDPASKETPPPVSASLSTYGNYLFAAASDEQCFFVQRTLYGAAGARVKKAIPEEALPPDRRLWPLPRTIDAVFSPNPPPLPGDRWSTGGERIALRQRRCDLPSKQEP